MNLSTFDRWLLGLNALFTFVCACGFLWDAWVSFKEGAKAALDKVKRGTP